MNRLLAASFTSDLLLQVQNDGDRLMEDEQFCLRLLTLQVQLTHATQFFEGFVDVSYPQPLTCVVGHPPLSLAFCLLLWIQIFILSDAAEQRETKDDKHLQSNLSRNVL